MQRKIQETDWAALITTLVVTAIAGLSFWLMFYVNGRLSQGVEIAISMIIIAIASFTVARLTIQQFVYTKVKIIFKTIHGTKAGSRKEEDQIARKSSLGRVEKEVTAWAEQRSTEIAALKERETFRREFIGNVSHELKTPIFNIQGYILTLIDGGLEDPNINLKYLKRASKSVDRMIDLIQDMDTLNKLESGVMEVKKKSCDILLMVQDVLDSLEDNAKEASITLKIKPRKKGESTMVLADPGRIEQVLFNLVTNAIKYGKKGGKVSISFFDLEDRLLVEVADDGLGIPGIDLSRIFERFYRVDKSRTRDAGGSGLGLSIVKHIIDSHGERINVQSKVGVGSTFSFTLQKSSL